MCHISLTCTDDSSVFVMAAVMLSPAQIEAVGQLLLTAAAVHVIQQYGSGTVGEVSQRFDCDRRPTSHLSADHLSVVHIPVIITHRSPDGEVEDFHSALTAVEAIHQTDARLL